MEEVSKQVCKGIEFPFLYMDELMKYLSDGSMHGSCDSSTGQLVTQPTHPWASRN